MTDIKITKDMTTAIEKLVALADGILGAKEALTEGYSNAQEAFAMRCAATAAKFNEEQYTAICEGLIGPNKERKAKASEAKKWGHVNVRTCIGELFTVARATNDGGSVVGVASKLATKLKSGEAKTPASAADQLANDAKKSVADAASPEGAKKRAIKAATHALKAAGFTDADVAPVAAAISALTAPSIVAAVKAGAEVQASEVLSAATGGGDDDLQRILAIIAKAPDVETGKKLAALLLS